MKNKMKKIIKKINELKKSKYFKYVFGILVVSLLSLIIYFSYGYYYDDNKGLVTKGIVSFGGDIIVNIYKQKSDGTYELTDKIPRVGYIYNESKTECTNVLSISFPTNNFNPILTSSKKGGM